MLDNQPHCIKNDKFLIFGFIEYVFTKVLPIPKPRNIGLNSDALHRSERASRRAELKKVEEDRKKKEKLLLKEEIQSKSGKAKLIKLNKAGKAEDDQEYEPDNETKVAESINDDTDFNIGVAFESDYVSQSCIWDMEVTYEMQVGLMSEMMYI